MRKIVMALAAAAMLSAPVAEASAQSRSSGAQNRDGTTRGASSGRKEQERGQQQIPRCSRNLGTIAIVEPDDQWWREYNLGSPEAILRLFVQRSGCFTMVNRGRSMQSRAMERALADQGELQEGSNLGRGQVQVADYFLQPDIVSGNSNSGGSAVTGILGGLLGGAIGGIVGGINIKKKEANVTLVVVNSRTTVEEALVEGYARKTDLGWAAGGGAGWWGGLAGAGGGSYQNTQIGQVIVLAYLDAYTKLIDEMGGLPYDAAEDAPLAQ
ncbi:penicillin-binding protein activator LpoB [Alteriqipengyuania sp. NZ-12B]|uniref:Penicillin-binding protein activator LpoB n=1 Tax=Alteriqipengyuania abyssalis TaxID=2860200 RepID=A0ABS7P8X4_9SPHN|nr:CsgG/HfaB family protein [Alteriqipengyuania abyssalis]MBY8335509.1 penicillin-binding protein activator LpoB [Alteriqipengyuania abyssalis]